MVVPRLFGEFFSVKIFHIFGDVMVGAFILAHFLLAKNWHLEYSILGVHAVVFIVNCE